MGHIWREKMLTVKQVFLVVAQIGRMGCLCSLDFGYIYSPQRNGRQRWLSGDDASCVVAEGHGRLVGAGFHLLVASPAETTQDADPFELSVSCVGVVPSLAPAEFCTTSPHRRYQNIFCEWSSSPLNVLPHFRLWGIFGVRRC